MYSRIASPFNSQKLATRFERRENLQYGASNMDETTLCGDSILCTIVHLLVCTIARVVCPD